MIYYGDYDTSKVIYMHFNTFDATGASVTVTDLAAGDVKIHKNGGTTQRSSSNGITVSIDYDTITGNHLIAIDTSDNTDAGFYAAGNDYQVRVEGITVATKTLNIWVGSFSIRNRSALMPTVAARTLDVASTGEAGLDFANINAASTPTTLTNITVPNVTTTATTTNVTNAVTITSNSDITAIKGKTDQFAFTTANQVDARVLTNSDKTGYTVSTVSDKTGYSISGTKTTLDALNDVSTSDINTQCTNALNTYDPPTNTEMNARTIVAANYATAANQTTIINKTNLLNASTTGKIDARIDFVGTNAVTSPDDFKADVSALATSAEITALNDITVADIIAGITDGTFDLQEMLRIMFAVLAGKSSGGGTNTINFRDAADTKNRVSATVDADGNRTAVTRDGA